MRVHLVIVLLAVVGGAQVAGLAGAILAVPALAMLRVLLDFFRPQLYVRRRVTPGPDSFETSNEAHTPV